MVRIDSSLGVVMRILGSYATVVFIVFASFCWTSCRSDAQTLDWEAAGGPYGYSGVAKIDYNNGRFFQQVNLWVHRDWVVLKTYNVLSPGETSLVDSRNSRPSESWQVLPMHSQVRRSTRFQETLTDSNEVSFTPFSVIRPYLGDDKRPAIEPADPVDGVETFRVQSSMVDAWIQFKNNRVVRVLMEPTGTPGSFAVDIEYREWATLPSGASVPTEVHSTRIFPGGNTSEALIRVADIKELGEDEKAPKFVIPSGFTVIDLIEGVTKHSDGTVIAPIERVQQQTQPQTSKQGRTQWGLLVGVVLIVASGLVWRIRAKARS